VWQYVSELVPYCVPVQMRSQSGNAQADNLYGLFLNNYSYREILKMAQKITINIEK